MRVGRDNPTPHHAPFDDQPYFQRAEWSGRAHGSLSAIEREPHDARMGWDDM